MIHNLSNPHGNFKVSGFPPLKLCLLSQTTHRWRFITTLEMSATVSKNRGLLLDNYKWGKDAEDIQYIHWMGSWNSRAISGGGGSRHLDLLRIMIALLSPSASCRRNIRCPPLLNGILDENTTVNPRHPNTPVFQMFNLLVIALGVILVVANPTSLIIVILLMFQKILHHLG